MSHPSINDIDHILPQTQCRECGYPACKPYAKAIACDGERIDLCAPGGTQVLAQIANLLEREPSVEEVETVTARHRPPSVATIREEECIGCTKCIQACPVDAIIGTGKHMHTILEQECTGCTLCIEPCPVDCIDLHAIATQHYDQQKAKARYQARQKRLHTAKKPRTSPADDKKRAYIEAALARINKK